jgi:hypothetical protein
MATTTKRLTDSSDEELGVLLDLVDESDSVELKLTVPQAEQASTVAALGLDPLDAQIRQVFFFDTPDLALNRHGLVARARRIQGKAHDSVVKLRPVVPDQLPRPLRDSASMVVEVDATPTGYVCSGTLKGKLGPRVVRQAVRGEVPLRKLFSKDQRAFFAAHAPDGIEPDDLSVLGPIFVLKLKSTPDGYDRKLVTELWLYPDGTSILELSTKCAPSEIIQVAAEARVYLARKGVDLSGDQQTKTKTALEFFAKRLKADSQIS